jgi:hypothetical protein
MATKSKRHIHKYYRALMNGNMVWTCMAPDCMHHMPKHYERGVLGKGFYCWACGKLDILRAEHLALDPHYFSEADFEPIHPICNNCANPAVVAFSDDVIKQALGEK